MFQSEAHLQSISMNKPSLGSGCSECGVVAHSKLFQWLLNNSLSKGQNSAQAWTSHTSVRLMECSMTS